MHERIHTQQFRANEAPELMALAWRLRHRIFNENLGWGIPHRDLLEIDTFDKRALHGAIMIGGHMAGYVRAMPTNAPYLLSEHFAHLLSGSPPWDREIVEISRFAVDPKQRSLGAQRLVVREGVALAQALGAKKMIAVTEPPFERFLKSCGLLTSRLAEPQIVGEGRHGPIRALVIACDLSPENLAAVGLLPRIERAA